MSGHDPHRIHLTDRTVVQRVGETIYLHDTNDDPSSLVVTFEDEFALQRLANALGDAVSPLGLAKAIHPSNPKTPR